jgi:hypothetical protein
MPATKVTQWIICCNKCGDIISIDNVERFFDMVIIARGYGWYVGYNRKYCECPQCFHNGQTV